MGTFFGSAIHCPHITGAMQLVQAALLAVTLLLLDATNGAPAAGVDEEAIDLQAQPVLLLAHLLAKQRLLQDAYYTGYGLGYGAGYNGYPAYTNGFGAPGFGGYWR